MIITSSKIASLVIILTLSVLVLPSISVVSAQNYGGYSFVSLTMSINVAGAGRITPGSGPCYYGQIVTATEEPNLGFAFDGWYVNGIYQGNQTSIQATMLQDCTILASFSRRVVDLTIAVNPAIGGTTAPGAGVANYTFGDLVNVQENPNSGYTFSGWYLDGTYIGAGTTARVNMTMDHQLNAFFSSGSGNSTLPTGPTPIPLPNIIPITNNSRPVLQFYCTSSTSLSGFNVRIDGSLVINGSANAVAMPYQAIQLSYSITGGSSWQPLAYLYTGDEGNFSAFWMPSASGNYIIQAVWFGNNFYPSVINRVNFVIAPPDSQSQTLFTVASNSTVTSFSYNAVTTQLTFGVSGPDGTMGFVQVCIPKSSLPDPTVLKVTLDGSTVDTTYLSSGNVWLVIFVYHHSNHNVVMTLNPLAATPTPTPEPTNTQTTSPTSTSSPSTNPTNSPSNSPSTSSSPTATPNVPEFQALVILSIIIVVVSLTIVIMLKKRTKNNA